MLNSFLKSRFIVISSYHSFCLFCCFIKLFFEKLLSPTVFDRLVFLKKQNPITIIVVDNFVRPLLEKVDFYYEKWVSIFLSYTIIVEDMSCQAT